MEVSQISHVPLNQLRDDLQAEFSHPEPFIGEQMTEPAKLVFVIIAILEEISGVAGNLLLLTVLFTSRSLRRRSFHYLFIANLAVADLLSLGYWMTFFVLDLNLGHHPVVDDAHCTFNAFAVCTCTAVSILSLTSISLNRYLHVCHHHLYSRIFSLPGILVWCFMLWVAGLAVSLPPLVGVGKYGYDLIRHICACPQTEDAGNEYVNICEGVFCVVPMIFVGYWNFAIFRHWNTVKLNLNTRYPPSESKQQNVLNFVERGGKDKLQIVDAEADQAKEGRSAAENIPAAAGPDEDATGDKAQPPLSLHLATNVPQEAAGSDQHDNTMQHFHDRLQKERARERAFVRSLLVVFLLMMVCSLPSGITMLAKIANPSLPLSPENFIPVFLVFYFNSSVNWVVYGLMNPSFRRGYVKLVRRVVGTFCRCVCPVTSGRCVGSGVASATATQSSGV